MTEELELTLGRPAAGGGFVGRGADGRVVFVRHGLPGETVRAVLTEEHARWARADAVEILVPSPDRVDPPCAFSGPGRCGGCDYQHATLEAQRTYKGQLLAEQLTRIAKLDLDVAVEAFDDGDGGLGTRTRVRYGVTESGTLGMRKRQSHDLIEVDSCPLGVEAITALDLSSKHWEPGTDVQVVALVGSDAPSISVMARSLDEEEAILGEGDDVLEADPAVQVTEVSGLDFALSAGSFWQIHRRAPEVLLDAVLDGLDLEPGDHVLDLYCGAGLFTKPIALAVGPTGSVTGIEASGQAVADAQENLAELSWATVRHQMVSHSSVHAALGGTTHAVLDPSRSGVNRDALRLLGRSMALHRIVMVSCSPATFARDLKVLLDQGWACISLRAFDLFEMTEHVECVAVLER